MLRELFKSIGSVCLLLAVLPLIGAYLLGDGDLLDIGGLDREHLFSFRGQSVSARQLMFVLGGIGVALASLGIWLMTRRTSK
jgi:hypothetical protein